MLSTVLLALVGSAVAQTSPATAELVARLKLAPSHVDRIHLLEDDQFVFDFFNADSGISTGSAGRTVSATSSNFPAVIGNGVAMTLGFLGPCGMNIPHTHPRATEINIAINGTLRTGMLAENGARFVFNQLPAGSATVFPMGAIHFEQNDGCEPAYFVAAFNDVDPGVDAIGQRYFGLPPDIVGAALGGIGVQEIAGLESKIPNNVAFGADECLKRCGLTRPPVQLTSQRQPRVSANALPSGFTGPAPPPAATPPPASNLAIPTPVSNAAGGVKGAVSDGSSTITISDHHLTPFLIALMALNGAFLISGLVGLVFFIRSRRRDGHKYTMTGGGTGRSVVFETGKSMPKSDYYDPYPSPGAFKDPEHDT